MAVYLTTKRDFALLNLAQSPRISLLLQKNWQKQRENKTGVINDPLGQTHSLASSEHCFLLFCFAKCEKWGRTYGQHGRKQ